MTQTYSPPRLLLTLDDVSAVTTLSPSTIWRRVADGTFPAPRKRRGRGSRALWHPDDLERWARKKEK